MPVVLIERPFQRYCLSSEAWLFEARDREGRASGLGVGKGVGDPGDFGLLVEAVCSRSSGMLFGVVPACC